MVFDSIFRGPPHTFRIEHPVGYFWCIEDRVVYHIGIINLLNAGTIA
jgi:hypothetical protein